MIKNELIVLLHVDLDAFGCMLNIEYKPPDTPKKYFFTNYGNLDQIVQQIKDYVLDNKNQNILIADVSFATNKQDLIDLDSIFSGTKILIDHHMYPDDFWDEFKNFRILWDTSKSATLLCNEFFGNQTKNQNLDKLSQIIDVYDIWKVDHKLFNFAQNLNEYFWTYDMQYLAGIVKSKNYNLPDDFSDVVKSINLKIQSDIQDYEKRKLIYRINELTVIFTLNWFNQINISEMKSGQNIVIGITPFGIIKVRINENAPYTDLQKIKLRELLSGEENTGHLNAFTYHIDHANFEKIMKEAERVVKIISEVMN